LIDHTNVVKLIEVLATNSKIFIVLELVSGGDLFDLIQSRNKDPVIQAERRKEMLISKDQRNDMEMFPS